MKKFILFFLCCLSFDLQAASIDNSSNFIKENQNKIMVATILTLLARPAYKLAMQELYGDGSKAFGLGSLIGSRLGIKPKTRTKEERMRAQVSVGSLDFKVKTPTHLMKKKKRKKNDSYRAAAVDSVMNVLESFSPYFHVGLENKTTPIVRDKTAGINAKTKRLFAELACGTFCMRTGMDLEDVILTPIAMMATYMMSWYNQSVIATSSQ